MRRRGERCDGPRLKRMLSRRRRVAVVSHTLRVASLVDSDRTIFTNGYRRVWLANALETR